MYFLFHPLSKSHEFINYSSVYLQQRCQACPCLGLGTKEGKEQEDNTDGVKEGSAETVGSLLWGFTCVTYQNRYSLWDMRGLGVTGTRPRF